MCANTQDVQKVDMKVVFIDKWSLQFEQNLELLGNMNSMNAMVFQ
jgi:hypothetical protein